VKLFWWVSAFWDWFWYFRKGKIKYRILNFGNTYCASAHNGKVSVWNCYGSTREQAIEIAKYKMRVALQGDDLDESNN
jgi:hypothetical protein